MPGKLSFLFWPNDFFNFSKVGYESIIWMPTLWYYIWKKCQHNIFLHLSFFDSKVIKNRWLRCFSLYLMDLWFFRKLKFILYLLKPQITRSYERYDFNVWIVIFRRKIFRSSSYPCYIFSLYSYLNKYILQLFL